MEDWEKNTYEGHWSDIKYAPKDGTHILVAKSLDFEKEPPTVAHWFQDGFYQSWCAWDEDADYQMSQIKIWAPLPI